MNQLILQNKTKIEKNNSIVILKAWKRKEARFIRVCKGFQRKIIKLKENWDLERLVWGRRE